MKVIIAHIAVNSDLHCSTLSVGSIWSSPAGFQVSILLEALSFFLLCFSGLSLFLSRVICLSCSISSCLFLPFSLSQVPFRALSYFSLYLESGRVGFETNVYIQWHSVYKAHHRIHICGNETIVRQ